MNVSFKTEENLSGNPFQLNNDSISMISRLANELYHEGLAKHSVSHNYSTSHVPEVTEQLAAAEAETTEQVKTIPSSILQPSLPNFFESTYQYIKDPHINNPIDMKKTQYSMNPVHSGDNSYYFLPGYQSVSHTKEAGIPNYRSGLDVYSIRKDFPILQRRINGKPLI